MDMELLSKSENTVILFLLRHYMSRQTLQRLAMFVYKTWWNAGDLWEKQPLKTLETVMNFLMIVLPKILS